MIYGQIQYFDDEVNSWKRSVVFHHTELREATRQLTAVLSFPVLSLSDSRTGSMFMDQLAVQDRQLAFLSSLIGKQGKRLALETAMDEFEPDIPDLQAKLRWKMNYYEQSFIRTKHDCSTFIATFFELDSVSMQA